MAASYASLPSQLDTVDMDPEAGSADERLISEGKEEGKKEEDEYNGNPKRRTHIHPTMHLLLYTITIVVSLILGYNLGYARNDSKGSEKSNLDECTRRTSQYSPVMREVPIQYSEQRFNGSLLKENIFRQEASPEVDAAWESLGVNCTYIPEKSRVIRMISSLTEYFHIRSWCSSASRRSRADRTGSRSGKNQRQIRRRVSSQRWGLAPSSLLGMILHRSLWMIDTDDASPQNLMRQALHWNYDYYRNQGTGPFKNDDYIVRKHTSKCPVSPFPQPISQIPMQLIIIPLCLAHCMDTIRQQLMCTPDIGMLGQIWIYPDSPMAYVDFNTKHTCKNFEAVRSWAEEHQLPKQVPTDFLSPPKKGDRIFYEMP